MLSEEEYHSQEGKVAPWWLLSVWHPHREVCFYLNLTLCRLQTWRDHWTTTHRPLQVKHVTLRKTFDSMFAFARHVYTFPATVVSVHLFHYLSLYPARPVLCQLLPWGLSPLTESCNLLHRRVLSDIRIKHSNKQYEAVGLSSAVFSKLFSNDFSILSLLSRKIQIHFLSLVLLRAIGVNTLVYHYRYLQSSVAGLWGEKKAHRS